MHRIVSLHGMCSLAHFLYLAKVYFGDERFIHIQFSILTALSLSITRFLCILGTYKHSAPEQHQNNKIKQNKKIEIGRKWERERKIMCVCTARFNFKTSLLFFCYCLCCLIRNRLLYCLIILVIFYAFFADTGYTHREYFSMHLRDTNFVHFFGSYLIFVWDWERKVFFAFSHWRACRCALSVCRVHDIQNAIQVQSGNETKIGCCIENNHKQ